jgi:DnaJ-class molecular chaperone
MATIRCPRCNGSGLDSNGTCVLCGGSGRVPDPNGLAVDHWSISVVRQWSAMLASEGKRVPQR